MHHYYFLASLIILVLVLLATRDAFSSGLLPLNLRQNSKQPERFHDLNDQQQHLLVYIKEPAVAIP